MAEQRCRVSGELDSANGDEVRMQLMSVVLDTHDDLVVDCDGLPFIDESVASVFARAADVMARSHRGFRVVNLHGNARRKIEMLGLVELFGLDSRS
jgi:anti-anti-sigma factor